MGQMLLTLAAGLALGYILQRLKVPGGMMLGAVLGALILNIGFEAAYLPLPGKITAQILAGAFIGCTVEKSDLKRLKSIFKPAAILLGVHLILNLTTGTIMYYFSPLDKMTAYMAAVPGGLSDIPLIASDMGADAPKVMVLQFIRMVVGIGVFPSLIAWVTRNEPQPGGDDAARLKNEDKRASTLLVTLAVGTVCGLTGYFLRVQAGTLVFALVGTVIFKLVVGRAYLPLWLKRVAQLLSGAYIGSSMGLADLLELRHLIVPMVTLLVGYSAGCFIIGYLLKRFCKMSQREGMMAGIPAGAADMALISSDMGIQSADLVVLQVIRLVLVVSIFPQVIALLTGFIK